MTQKVTLEELDIGGGRSNIPGDQTGSIAVKNVDEQERIRKYCERIERSVRRLQYKNERMIDYGKSTTA